LAYLNIFCFRAVCANHKPPFYFISLNSSKNILFEKEPASNYVIIISGDLVEKATDSSSYAEAKLYIDLLKDAGFRVLVIPGNHDYAGQGYKV
jgi:predicted MPP superfamily phosphohydrolase